MTLHATTLLLLALVAAAQASSTRKLLAQAPQTLSGGRRAAPVAARAGRECGPVEQYRRLHAH